MKQKRVFLSLFSIVTGVLLLGCDLKPSGNEPNESSTLSVVTTFYPVYEFTQEVAGNRADVSMVIQAGTDVHGFEPSAKDVAAINDADVFVYSSGEMEPWVGSLMNSINSENLSVVRTADTNQFIHAEEHAHEEEKEESSEPTNEEILVENKDVPESIELNGLSGHYHTGDVVQLVADSNQKKESDKLQWYVRKKDSQNWEAVSGQTKTAFEYETTGESIEVKVVLYDDTGKQKAQSASVEVVIDNHEDLDPHVWLDPILAQDQVNTIKDALIQADPDGKSYYEENAEEFNSELQQLDEEYQAAFSSATNRVFVVQHQAFGYIARRYDLEQIAVGGISTEVEPSPSRIAEINKLVTKYNVPVIYYQQGANSSIAQTVAQETGTEIEVLYDLESVTEEMQAEGLDYLSLMRKNLEALKLSIQ